MVWMCQFIVNIMTYTCMTVRGHVWPYIHRRIPQPHTTHPLAVATRSRPRIPQPRAMQYPNPAPANMIGVIGLRDRPPYVNTPRPMYWTGRRVDGLHRYVDAVRRWAITVWFAVGQPCGWICGVCWYPIGGPYGCGVPPSAFVGGWANGFRVVAVVVLGSHGCHIIQRAPIIFVRNVIRMFAFP